MKQNASRQRRIKLAESINTNKTRDLWTELKKMNNINSKTVNSLDGHDDEKDIAEHLAGKYRAIFSSARTDDAVLDKLKQTIDDRVLSEHHHSYTITVENVINAIRNLNTDKSDGMRGTCSNHFIYASHRFYVVFSVLINAMIVHGYSADELLQSVLVSIPKDARGDLLASDNYRGIGKLFSLLCDRNLPGVVIRFLLDSYSRQNVFTRWNNVLSNAIHMENGVKQGGVLSPILFCVNFDELLKRLESSGMGCYIGHHFYGCVGYADDVKLLCPSINGLQSMNNVCEDFADEFDVTFNTKNTMCICYGSDNNATLRQLSSNGGKIPWQSTVKHLGNVLMYNLHDEADVYNKRGGGGGGGTS